MIAVIRCNETLKLSENEGIGQQLNIERFKMFKNFSQVVPIGK